MTAKESIFSKQILIKYLIWYDVVFTTLRWERAYIKYAWLIYRFSQNDKQPSKFGINEPINNRTDGICVSGIHGYRSRDWEVTEG